MTCQIFPGKPRTKPTLLGALTRIGDGSGLHPVGSDTMSLSTPIASVQDGPRMTTQHFGSKKAAPFRKGGKRRKALLAKDAIAKAKKSDYSNIDLAAWTHERRDRVGKWTGGGVNIPRNPEAMFQAEKNMQSYSRKITPTEAALFDAKNMVAKARLSGKGLPKAEQRLKKAKADRDKEIATTLANSQKKRSVAKRLFGRK